MDQDSNAVAMADIKSPDLQQRLPDLQDIDVEEDRRKLKLDWQTNRKARTWREQTIQRKLMIPATIGTPLVQGYMAQFLLPGTPERAFRSWLVLLMTLYNAIMLPFGFYESSWTRGSAILIVLNALVDVIFILDLIANFYTPFINKWSRLVWDKQEIVTRYKNEYFIWDLLAAAPFDYIAHIMGWSLVTNGYQVARTNRVFRFHRLYSDPLLQSKNVLLRIVRLCFMLLLLCHWAGTLFFLLGYHQSEPNPWTGESWTRQYGSEENEDGIQSADFYTQYSSGFYFAVVTILTVGYGDITPKTNVEKFSATIAIVIGALFYAVIFGNVSLLISQMNAGAQDHRVQMDRLEQFIKTYKTKLPSKLRKRLRSKMKEQYLVHQGMHADSVLKHLPQSVRADALVMMRAELVARFQPFTHIGARDFDVIRDLVMGTYTNVFLADEYIFRKKEQSDCMGFVAQGGLVATAEHTHGEPVLEYIIGDAFGGVEMLLRLPRWNSVYTTRNSEVVFLSAKHYFNVMNSHSPALAAKFTKQALEMYQEIKEKFISPASQRAHKNWRFLAKCSRQIGLIVIEGRTQRALQQFYQSEFWHAANDKQEGAHSVKLNTALAEGKSPEEPIDTGAVTLHISDKRESSVMVGVAYAKFKNLRKRGMRRRSSAGVEGSRGNDSQTNFILPEAAVLTEADA